MTAKPQIVSLRIKVSPSLYAKVREYRFEARHESMQQALRCLVNAGLIALSKPPVLPQPDRPKQLVAYAGNDGNARRAS